jgi:CIC family chloride channel protein
MGATLGTAFASLVGAVLPGVPVSLPAFAMVGMGAMVGGGTGAAMTMIFEMTLDYDIVLPMIVAVALSLGTRRMLSRQNMYTAKLARRGHPVPRRLHANLFFVQSARDVMERDVALLDEATTFTFRGRPAPFGFAAGPAHCRPARARCGRWRRGRD